ncbi:MAG TPA: CheR family methyltransferase [Nitrospiria bacterium]|jgi:chemotaxis protein methyltransferase CheR
MQNIIELSNDVYKLLRDIFYDHCGIFYDDKSKYFLEGRLQNRLQKHQFHNFKDYYYFLKYDRKKEEELAYVIDLLTIHETYFFREERQLKVFSEEVLSELEKKKEDRKTLRIWSAGCSTGEEPYTLAMLIMQEGYFRDWKVEIFASDISQRVLQSARRGIYQQHSFRCTDPFFVKKFFHNENHGFRISDDVKKYVTFLCVNLLDINKLAFINTMDIIFCRNVIIYFDQEAKRKVIETFHRKLNREGYLFLGHSESLLNISTDFALRHFKHDIIYQRGS